MLYNIQQMPYLQGGVQLVWLLSVITVSLASAARPHYSDPNTLVGCLPDELKVRVTGVAGDLCSPDCSDGRACPKDFPASAKAVVPSCSLKSGSGGTQSCALLCTAASDCGAKASCKAASSSKSGICTFDDDLPPPTKHWAPIASATFRDLQTVLAVAFTEDGQTGFAGANTNGVGARVVKTTDRGITWEPVWPKNSTKPKMNILLAAAVKSNTSAVVSGVLDNLYTTTGDNFSTSIEGLLEPSNAAYVIKETGQFAFVGSGNKNGVRLSSDGNKWAFHDLPASTWPNGYFPARYGAFPSAKTWFVSAGLFPNQQSKEERHQKRMITSHIALTQGKFELVETTAAAADNGPVNCSVDTQNCYSAGIYVTNDAGATWTTVYESVNDGKNVYPNQIDCASETHCVAAMEGPAHCSIIVTKDGGKHWIETLKDTERACSLVAVRMLDEKEGWVSGGNLGGGPSGFEGRFWHTQDGGDTWVKEAAAGQYIVSFDLVGPSSGHAVALDRATECHLWEYKESLTLAEN